MIVYLYEAAVPNFCTLEHLNSVLPFQLWVLFFQASLVHCGGPNSCGELEFGAVTCSTDLWAIQQNYAGLNVLLLFFLH